MGLLSKASIKTSLVETPEIEIPEESPDAGIPDIRIPDVDISDTENFDADNFGSENFDADSFDTENLDIEISDAENLDAEISNNEIPGAENPEYAPPIIANDSESAPASKDALPAGAVTYEADGHAEPPREEAEFFLDEMGSALKERISRLPAENNTPFAVLSLLKAYGNFQSAICLKLVGESYSTIAALGMGSENVSIPALGIWSEENSSLPFFRLDSKKEQGIPFASAGAECWAIPLTAPDAPSHAPWEGLMILGVAGNTNAHSIFDAESIAAILSGNAGKILPQNPIEQKLDDEEAIPEEKAGETETAEDIEPGDFSIGPNSTAFYSIRGKISQYHRSHNEFNCIILEIPISAGEEEKVHFCENVVRMIGMAGSVITLSSGCPLILLPRETDRELIAHRLTGSLRTRAVMSFKSNNPENACETIHSLL